MSVCIYSPSEKIWGGGQIYIEGLCRFLNEEGVDAFIATSEPETFSVPTMGIVSVASKNRRIISAPTIAKILKSKGVQVVVLNDLSSLWLAPVFRFFGFKVVSLLHLYLQIANEAGHGHGWLAYQSLRFSSLFVHRIYSVNKNNQEVFPVKVEWIGNYISEWFLKAPEVPSKKYDLGLISRFSPEKNIPLFVRLVANLNGISKHPVKALIVGKGSEEALIRATISDLGMGGFVDVLPWVDRDYLPNIYDQLRCFAITSHHEGFATTLLEAHARGVPAICTRSAGFCGELLKMHPSTGIVFEPPNVESLDFLEQVLNLIDESNFYHEKCRRKAALFSESRVLGEITSGIKALLDGFEYEEKK